MVAGINSLHQLISDSPLPSQIFSTPTRAHSRRNSPLRTNFCNGFSPWATVPAREPSLVWTPQITRKHTASLQSMDCRRISPPAPVAHPYLPCSLMWVSAGLSLLHFHCFYLSQWLHSVCYTFSTVFSQRHHQIIKLSCALQQVHWSQLGLAVTGKRQNLALFTEATPAGPSLTPWYIKQIQKDP